MRLRITAITLFLLVATTGGAHATRQATFTLGLRIASTDAAVTADPAGALVDSKCPADVCTYRYPAGTTVTLTENVLSGSSSRFVGWLGGCAGTAPTCSVVVYRDRRVDATFTPTRLAYDTSAGGHIELVPAGSLCTDPKLSCNEFAYNTFVVARAVPDPGFTAGAWLEDCAFAAPTHGCGIHMNRDRLIRARFDQIDGDTRQGQMGELRQIVAIVIIVQGNGKVTSGALSCTQSSLHCVRSKARGQVASLLATPAPGYRLLSWSGRCSGTKPQCSVAGVRTSSGGNPTVVATFSR